MPLFGKKKKKERNHSPQNALNGVFRQENEPVFYENHGEQPSSVVIHVSASRDKFRPCSTKGQLHIQVATRHRNRQQHKTISPFVDMQSFHAVDTENNFGALVPQNNLPTEEPTGQQVIGAMSRYLLICKIPELKKKHDYDQLFTLLRRYDGRIKRCIVYILETVLLRADPARLQQLDMTLFFIKGPNVVTDEIVRSAGDPITLNILSPLFYYILSLTNIYIVNGQFDDEMKRNVSDLYRKRSSELGDLIHSTTCCEVIKGIHRTMVQFLKMNINMVFRVMDWTAYFRDKSSRQKFVKTFPSLYLKDRCCALFLLGNLTLRRENRDNTISLLHEVTKIIVSEEDIDGDGQVQVRLILEYLLHFVLNAKPSSKIEQLAESCLKIIESLSQRFSSAELTHEVQSRMMFCVNPNVRIWVREKRQLLQSSLPDLIDSYITHVARNLHLEIDMSDSTIPASNVPVWIQKPCMCLGKVATLNVLYPSENCLKGKMTEDYKKTASERETKLKMNELDCLIRLQSNGGHDNVVTLLCHQCVPMPLFYVVENNNGLNMLTYLLKQQEDKGRIKLQSLLEMCIQAIEGVNFLHGHGIVHRDITSDAFICSDKGGKVRVQLAVLRIATYLWKEGDAPSRTLTDVNCDMVPTRWTAPESLLRGQYSFQSDIWMVGILLCEMFNHGAWPYTEVPNVSIDTLMQNIVFYGRRPGDGYMPIPVFEIVKECLHDAPDGRPSFQNALKKLNSFKSIAENSKRQKQAISHKVEDTWDYFLPNKAKVTISDNQKHNNMLPERGIPKSFEKYWNIVDPHEKFIVEQNERLREKRRLTLAISETDIHTPDSPTRERQSSVPCVILVKECVSDEFVQKSFELIKLNKEELQLIEDPLLSEQNQDKKSLTYSCKDGCALFELVHERSIGENLRDYLPLILQAAEYIAFLHRKGWILRCLRPQDIYVNREGQQFYVYIPRLGAFRRLPGESNIYDSVVEKISPDLLHWSPPEVIEGGFHSHEGDVWSFGMCIWQICCILSIEPGRYSGDNVAAELRSTPFSHVPTGELQKHLTEGKLPEDFDFCPQWLNDLLTECWNHVRSDRPSMERIVQDIRQNTSMDSNDSSSSGYAFKSDCIDDQVYDDVD